ncbi:MAG TPA: chemotaxis protein CheW [Opitutaceae bacterium]|nr:chemotaxis protein CheW [Opitutaceae bacterium]
MSEPVRLALFRIGPIHLAFPARWVEEVVRGPVDLTPFPAAARHVLGAFALRGRPVPTLDLAAMVQPAAASEPLGPVAFAVVLRHETGRCALQVDEVLGLVTPTADRLTALETRGGPGLFSQLYTPADGGRVVVVLDLEAILQVDGVRSALHAPLADEATAPTPTAAAAGEATAARAHVVVRVGTVRVGLDAERVRSVEVRPSTLSSTLRHPVMRGFHPVLGRMVPVVDLGALLGFESADSSGGSAPWVVYEHAGWRIALMVDEVLTLERVSDAATGSPPAQNGGHPEFVSGSFRARDGALVLQLKEDAMRRTLGVEEGVEESHVETGPTADQGRTTATAQVEPTRYVVHRAGGAWFATELAGLETVLPLPDDFLEVRTSGEAAAGVCLRLGQSLAVVDLAVLLGAPPTVLRPGGRLLCVTTTAGRHGFVVDAVDSLHAAVPRLLPRRDTARHGVVPPFTHMIRVRAGGADRAVCVLDLATLARQIFGSSRAA